MKALEPKWFPNLFQTIVNKDCYALRGFPPNHFDAIVDIGAHIGILTVYARMLFPDARIYAFEPVAETRQALNANCDNLNINLNNKALGLGGPAYLIDRDDKGSQYFSFSKSIAPNIDMSHHKEPIPTSTLAGLLSECDLGNNYFLKIDCEGGESSIIGDSESEQYVRNAKHVGMEMHFGRKNHMKGERFLGQGCVTFDEGKEWLSQFKNTHDIFWTDDPATHADIRGVVVLRRKDA